jgi:hypothetical protein
VNWDAEATLLAVAATQLGLFTARQAYACGVTRKMLRTRFSQGAWKRHLYRGVFVVAGHPTTPATDQIALVLAVDAEGVRSSHRGAAWLWGMTPFPQKPEVTVPCDVRCHLKDARVHRTATALLEPVVRKDVPATTAAETLLDLGAVVSLEKVRDALDRGIAKKIVTPMSALAELERRGKMGVRGTAALRALLDRAGVTGSHPPSVLEAKTRRLIQKAGLPQPQCELIVGVNGEYRLDFTWPELMLAIEVDGWMYHSSFEAFHGNKTRKNTLTVQGYAILEYTWVHVTQTPHDVIREVKAAYAARSRLLVGH